MTYIKITGYSWHAILRVDDAGWWTRCGRLVTTETTPVAKALPLDEKSCETCARLTLHDQDQQNVANDEVVE